MNCVDEKDMPTPKFLLFKLQNSTVFVGRKARSSRMSERLSTYSPMAFISNSFKYKEGLSSTTIFSSSTTRVTIW